MSLSDQIKSELNKVSNRLCKIGRLLPELSKEDRESLVDALEKSPHSSGGLSNVQIHKILLSEGYDIGLSTVDRHRNKTCGCYVAERAGR